MSQTKLVNECEAIVLNKRQRNELGIPNEYGDSVEFNLKILSKRSRCNDINIDLQNIMTDEIDDEKDIEKLFEGKFQEKSPSAKLASSFNYLGLKESNFLKKPKLSTIGRRTIGLTSEERDRKHGMNRGINFSSATVDESKRNIPTPFFDRFADHQQ